MSKKVFVSGCYDMLHSGHIAFFRSAATYGDLVVALGSDKTLYAFCDESGWIYYRATRGASNSMIALHPNGNAFNPETVKIDAFRLRL